MTLRQVAKRRWRVIRHSARASFAALALAGCSPDKNLGPEPKPATMRFIASPAASTAGVPINPPVQVVILDAAGHQVTNANNSVTISFALNPVGATLSGTTTVSAVNGLATFSDLSIDKASEGYALAASSAGLPFVSSQSFSINAASPAQLTFMAPPNSTTIGALI